ncbi:efflux RND transporter periplasmic adaptor subunit [Candidatus Methylobacter oryzae]|uniref:Efflux RND transporter periplasmic adaptor subunit n=1 Tax=Candidatus Methylobacter oryzae TaxID=2497749 RepID=A0ABY3CEN8_9GAMM|nr:efflux RND transporter periplasmic adaptor subunit [Candidatus Methylobacter oryzae]TRX01611.1 efflux RND transporter periplasmic adaptor subunit [Candidatus Methylobacter oryzae]
MSSHQTPVFALPSHPQRTLVIAKRSGFGLLLFLLLAGGWRLAINQSEADSLRQRTEASLTRSVIAVRSKPGEASRKITLPAGLRGNTETQLYARSNGYLSAWYKTIGDQVKKGELLAVIDVPELEQELAQAHAAAAQIKVRLELARSTLKRWALLKDTDSVVQQEFDEKRSAVLQAEADLAAAEVNVKRLEKIEEYRRIVAPFSGVITRRSVDVGSLINAGSQELFALTQTDPLRLTVWVPQAYADDVKVGQEVAVRAAGAQGKPLAARVEHVAGALDPVNRSRQVDITLPNKEGKLLPGSYMEASINVVGSKAGPLVVPANVLVIDQAGTHVVVVDAEKRVAFRPVKLGRDFGREVEILEGVAANDVLVASPSDLLAEGEIVSVVEAQQKADGKSKEKPVAG